MELIKNLRLVRIDLEHKMPHYSAFGSRAVWFKAHSLHDRSPSSLFLSWVEGMLVLIKLKFNGNLVAMWWEGAAQAQVH